MSLKKALLAATVLALPMSAQAQPVTGLYFGAGAGVNWLSDSDLTATGQMRQNLQSAGINPAGSTSFDIGWAVVGSLGWGFGNGLRAELEGNFRSNTVDTISGFNGVGGGRRATGDVQSWGFMVNALYDFDLGPGSFVMPYIGGGIGYGTQNWNSVRVSGSNGAVTLNGDDGAFAYQAIVGAAFPIRDVPGLAVTLEYRFMGQLETTIDARATNAAGAQVGARSGAFEVENQNQSILLGVRYNFGVAPAPAPAAVAPAAAPAPARTFLVFFDWDRADLTDRARQIIAEAATNAQRGGVTRIEVSGHADRTGTPQYNMQLSMRRAQNVAAELERRGIARSAMTLQAFGETRPLVPTADNVREPQNRRVEIVLR
jgi:outer membrane protein OmpA-like peptidoglycan-associated protein